MLGTMREWALVSHALFPVDFDVLFFLRRILMFEIHVRLLFLHHGRIFRIWTFKSSRKEILVALRGVDIAFLWADAALLLREIPLTLTRDLFLKERLLIFGYGVLGRTYAIHVVFDHGVLNPFSLHSRRIFLLVLLILDVLEHLLLVHV